jgi:hypothetical protein
MKIGDKKSPVNGINHRSIDKRLQNLKKTSSTK